MTDDLTLDSLTKTVKDFQAKWGPPPGPLVMNPVDLPWFRQQSKFDHVTDSGWDRLYSADIPRHPFAGFVGLNFITDDNMPPGILACDDGKGAPTVFYGIGHTIGAPRHRKLRLNRLRRQKREVNKAAAIAMAHRYMRMPVTLSRLTEFAE